jgi:predicted nucleic acid-binding protein
MSRFLLDTDVLIDVSRDREPALSLEMVLSADKAEIGICPVQLAEFYAGQDPGDRPAWDAFVNSLICWKITAAVGQCAVEYRRAFARHGQAIGTPDALNAAVAWTMGAAMVTGTGKDYPMAGVEVIVP